MADACERAGDAGHQRQCQPVQREQRQGHLSDPRGRRWWGCWRGARRTPSAFQAEGDVVALLGRAARRTAPTWRRAPYLRRILRPAVGPPQLDLAREHALQRLTLEAIAEGCSARARLLRWRAGHRAGGVLPVVGAGPARRGGGLPAESPAQVAALFGEAPSRVVVSLAPERWEALARWPGGGRCRFTRLGVVGGERLHWAPVWISGRRAASRRGGRARHARGLDAGDPPALEEDAPR